VEGYIAARWGSWVGWGRGRVNVMLQIGQIRVSIQYPLVLAPISWRFRDKRRFPSKFANFPIPLRVLNAPAEGVPLGNGYQCKGRKSSNDGATRWSKKF